MSRSLEWSELKTGVAAFGVIVALTIAILVFARVGALHGDTSSIYVITDEAPGVLNGTEVWLSGLKIGLVKDVHFRSVNTDTAQRIAIHTTILSNRMYLIRRDAYADIRPGGNLIGSPIVFIASGTSAAPALKDGDTLVTRSNSMMKPVGNRVAAIGARVGMLADSGSRVIAILNSQMGTLGKITREGIPKIAATTGGIASMMGKATSGGGSVGLMMQGDFPARVARIRAEIDSITGLLSSGNGNVGKLRGDSTLFRTVAHLRGEIDSLRAAYSAGNGIARARTDTALAAQMARMRVELGLLMADVKKHPTRYISF